MDRKDFEAFYEMHVAMVHRSVRRLGVGESTEDVVQEVFIVAYRRLPEFEGLSSISTWLYGIVLRVVRLHRRTTTRSRLHGIIDGSSGSIPENVPDHESRRPDAAAERADAYRLLLALLDELTDDQREVFVLAELEQLPVPQIAKILELNVNTAYSRLRLARAAFQAARAEIGSGA